MRWGLRWFRRAALIEQVIPYRLALRLRILAQHLTGVMEPETRLLKGLVSRGDRVVDAGANAGVYTYLLSKLGCKVESFEPLDYYVTRLRSARLKNVRIHHLALSDKGGEGIINIPLIDGAPRLARASLDDPAGNEVIQQHVRFTTLDSLCFNDLRFIKIDVEGHEFSVLRGGEETIIRCKPTILIEIENHRLSDSTINDFFVWFRDRGYSGYFYRAGVRMPVEAFDLSTDQKIVDEEYKSPDFVNNFIFLSDMFSGFLPERT